MQISYRAENDLPAVRLGSQTYSATSPFCFPIYQLQNSVHVFSGLILT